MRIQPPLFSNPFADGNRARLASAFLNPCMLLRQYAGVFYWTVYIKPARPEECQRKLPNRIGRWVYPGFDSLAVHSEDQRRCGVNACGASYASSLELVRILPDPMVLNSNPVIGEKAAATAVRPDDSGKHPVSRIGRVGFP